MSLLSVETIEITRKSDGSYVDGHYVDGASSIITIKANVQPMIGREIEQLPEADRYRESWKVFATSRIQVNDIITRGEKSYEVRSVKDLTTHGIPHYEAVMLLVEGQS